MAWLTHDVELRDAAIERVSDLARIPIAFLVERVYDVHASGTPTVGRPVRFTLSERVIDVPYLKDYDQIEGEGPMHWARRYDVRPWGYLQARSSAGLLGGAVVAFRTPELTLLEGRADLAALWDIRVTPAMRGHGLGTKLFQAAEDWARARSCHELRVETQNVNVAACRFYQRQGCVLHSVGVGAYPSLPDEVQLIWSKVLKH